MGRARFPVARRGSPYVWTPPQPREFAVRGWRGAYDSLAPGGDSSNAAYLAERTPGAQQLDEAILLRNLFPTDLQRAGSLAFRAGRLWNATATQLTGNAGGTQGQFLGQMRRPDASNAGLSVAVISGEVWTFHPAPDGTGSSTKVLSTAQLTAAGVALPSGNNVLAIPFAGVVVFVDMVGNTQPFSWDGTTVGGGIVKLTSLAAAAYISATIYYGRLFLLMSDQKTLVWSEPNQPNVGYNNAPFANIWDLSVQTGQSDLRAIVGTNEAIYLMRWGGVGTIRGTVTSTFSTDGTLDSIVVGNGCGFHSMCCYVEGTLFWVDQAYQPHGYRPGVGHTRLSDQLPRYGGYPVVFNSPLTTPFDGSLGEGVPFQFIRQCYPDLGRGRVLFAGNYGAQGIGRWVMEFDAKSLRLLGFRTYPLGNVPSVLGNASQMAAVVMDDGQDWVEVYADNAGWLFGEARSVAVMQVQSYDTDHLGNRTAITGVLVGPAHGWDENTEWSFQQLDVVYLAPGPTATITVGYLTSRQWRVGLTPADQVVAEAGLTNFPQERHLSFGLLASGRWCRPVIQLTGPGTAGETSGHARLELLSYKLKAVARAKTVSIT